MVANKLKRISSCLALCLAMTMLSGITVFAAEKQDTEQVISLSDIEKYQSNVARTNSNEIVITDPEAIKELATMQGFPDVENIKKLTYTIGETSAEETTAMEQKITSWNVIGNVEDKGTGFMLVDHFDENRYQGPISGTYTYSRTDTCAYNADVSISTDIISSKVGFTIGSSVTKSDSVTINVPAGKKIILKIWTNYQKKSFTIYREYSNCVGLWYPEGSGNAYKPVGLIFTQAEY